MAQFVRYAIYGAAIFWWLVGALMFVSATDQAEIRYVYIMGAIFMSASAVLVNQRTQTERKP
jgi:hypothetical protein